jgi:hypothetical protein
MARSAPRLLLFVLAFAWLPANAALISTNNGLTVYDVDRDLTWIANANLAASDTFGLAYGISLGIHPLAETVNPLQGVINANGSMNWPGALIWIDAMNASNYLGYSDWRLPTARSPDGGSPGGFENLSDMGHLVYEELDLDNGGNSNLALFSNLQRASYWTGTTAFPAIDQAGHFSVQQGTMNVTFKSANLFAFAVRDGNVSPVPLPAGVWLLFSGLSALGVAVRRQSRAIIE